ncbi:hypothetical protein ES677_05500 [Bizionia gelidisalsuginis]|uniref:Uncharacterized protein n=2 Tax=Bizionia TaxID=283785 RepID=A0A8H2LDI7_9FLAO|nr:MULTISPECIES: hypothetical protein [Bizionia]TYB73066.1 hypothetical protein ES676_09930 [Bizionia saleffrena]TYC14836.1 hypothetical protein ES677_05500 [Bizionia gelidisalsuginis]
MLTLGILVLGIIIGGGITYLLLKNSLSSQGPGVPIVPAGVITPVQARDLDENWTTLRKVANDTAAAKPDNRSSWYSLADMENFITLTKSENAKTNGFRMYLGVKTTETDETGYTTIFMVATEDDRGANKDIPTAKVLDMGGAGYPPQANYPQ